MHRLFSLSILIAIAPLFYYLPIWVSIWCVTVSAIQIFGISERMPKNIGNIFAIIGLIILLSTNSAYYKLDFSVALLALMTTIKPLENIAYRDKAVSICMAYFVTLTCLWYSNSLALAIYSAAAIVLNTATLGIANKAFDNFKNSSKLAVRILAQSAPFALLLFISFPRLNGSLWGLNVSSPGTASGFSDSLTMGEVTQIAKDDSVAFRVEFQNKIPKQKYWKGVIFSFFDGKNWSKYGDSQTLLNKREGLNPINYKIILEPHGKKWLFSLDYPLTAPAGTTQTVDGVLSSNLPVFERKMYSLTSISTKSDFINRSLRRINTRLPYDTNPRTFELVSSWKKKGLTGEEIVKEALEYFSQNNFKYSLQPPANQDQFIDDFLFRTKEGYCEHFASAFTFMMRAANIPARIIGGYLGGELNKNYLIVRQSDAHVWAEVWIKKYGWLRIDPTSVIMGENNNQADKTQAASLRTKDLGLISNLIMSTRLKIDSINFAWDKWVLGYDRKNQEGLLEKLGLIGKHTKATIIVFSLLFLTLGFGLISAYIYNSAGRRKKLDKTAKSYEKLINKFNKYGIEKPPGMGPDTYRIELEKSFPEIRDSIDSIMQLYIKIRFEQNHNPEEEEIFSKLVNELKVPKNRLSL